MLEDLMQSTCKLTLQIAMLSADFRNKFRIKTILDGINIEPIYALKSAALKIKHAPSLQG